MSRRQRWISLNRLAFLIFVSVVFYNEIFGYFQSYMAWPKNISDENHYQVLLVADPQLQGVLDEPAGLQGIVQRWDSDRYLRNTFSWVTGYYKLDAIVFLGDLLDEGAFHYLILNI